MFYTMSRDMVKDKNRHYMRELGAGALSEMHINPHTQEIRFVITPGRWSPLTKTMSDRAYPCPRRVVVDHYVVPGGILQRVTSLSGRLTLDVLDDAIRNDLMVALEELDFEYLFYLLAHRNPDFPVIFADDDVDRFRHKVCASIKLRNGESYSASSTIHDFMRGDSHCQITDLSRELKELYWTDRPGMEKFERRLAVLYRMASGIYGSLRAFTGGPGSYLNYGGFPGDELCAQVRAVLVQFENWARDVRALRERLIKDLFWTRLPGEPEDWADRCWTLCCYSDKGDTEERLRDKVREKAYSFDIAYLHSDPDDDAEADAEDSPKDKSAKKAPAKKTTAKSKAKSGSKTTAKKETVEAEATPEKETEKEKEPPAAVEQETP